MPTFDDREREFEARFKHDEELAFKIKARRNKLLGLWAARHMGLDAAAAEAYAKDVVGAAFGPHHGRGVVEKVFADLRSKDPSITEARVEDELHRCTAEAQKQVEKE